MADTESPAPPLPLAFVGVKPELHLGFQGHFPDDPFLFLNSPVPVSMASEWPEHAAHLEYDEYVQYDELPVMEPFGMQARILRMCLADHPEPRIQNTPLTNNDTAVGVETVTGSSPCSGTSPEVVFEMQMPEGDLTTPTAAPTTRMTVLDCLTCGRQFSSKGGLVRHTRTMHGPRVWHLCDVCGKSLSSAYSLRHHKMRHLGQRPFTCSHCGAGFLRRGHLNQHVVKVHGDDDQDDDLVVENREVDVGVRIVHHHVLDGGGSGSVVFQRTDDGGVVGVVATAGHPQQGPRPPTETDGRIVMRLVRCGDPDVWRIEHLRTTM